MRTWWGDGGVLLSHGETEWKLPKLLYVSDMLLAESGY